MIPTTLSFWEKQTWMHDIDYAVIGSGIVGLSCALSLRNQYPEAKIVVFERGILPSGASTKNAGFACFGSVSEIWDDLQTHSEQEVMDLISKRYSGLAKLRATLGDKAIEFEHFGGYELFTLQDQELFESCLDNLDYLNKLTKAAISTKNDVFLLKSDQFGFKNVQNTLIFNPFEAQINTGKMMQALLKTAISKDILVLNSTKIEGFGPKNDQISLEIEQFGPVLAKKLFIATNGFASTLLKEDILPARAQVLVTKPIPNLHLRGTYHLDKGYYYFRNVGNRVLFGGGRNLDKSGETTTEMETTALIQNQLEHLLSNTILNGIPYEIEQRWSGIMGVGTKKKPIVAKVEDNVYCGIRMGGMGVAIGSLIGDELAHLADT